MVVNMGQTLLPDADPAGRLNRRPTEVGAAAAESADEIISETMVIQPDRARIEWRTIRNKWQWNCTSLAPLFRWLSLSSLFLDLLFFLGSCRYGQAFECQQNFNRLAKFREIFAAQQAATTRRANRDLKF
jgi:hypothetical protein